MLLHFNKNGINTDNITDWKHVPADSTNPTLYNEYYLVYFGTERFVKVEGDDIAVFERWLGKPVKRLKYEECR